MGSLRGKFEITEANDKPSSTTRHQTFRQSRVQNRDQKPPVVKKGANKTLEDDINKLFEAVNLRSSKSLDLSYVRRNASKKPIKGSHSPGIGFSEPASLKQALRGLCISQAAEMAAMKRLSLPASPRISEAGKISKMYRSVVVETGESSCLSVESGRRIEISLVPEENASCSDEILPSLLQDSATKLPRKLQDSTVLNQSACTSPLKPAAVVKEDAESKKVHSKAIPISQVEGDCSSVSSLDKVPTSLKTVDRAAPKLRPKSRLQTVSSSTSVVKSNTDVSTRRNTSHAVKPVVKNKNLITKKPKKVAIHSDGNSKGSHEVNRNQDHKPEKLICERCQCSLKDTIKGTSNNPFDIAGVQVCDASKLVSVPTDCGFSSSTTGLSDESNLSCNNKPHMSNDIRWEAINHIRQKFGFLGLNHFNLLKKLGSGDIGTVYLAEMIGMDCLFAIKVMDNEFLAKRKKLPRARTEKEILRMLDHPFLPTLYAQFTSDNLSCLVMEFCPGGDLHVLRQKQPGRYFPEQAARFYVAEVLLALEYLHMLGIVYRDLKPENILVREDGHIMLTDFDLSLRCSTNPTLVKSSSLAMEPPRISGPCAGSNCVDHFCTGPSCKVSCFSPRIIPNKGRARKLKADARLLPRLVAEPTEARSNSFVGTHEYLAPEIIKGEGHGSAVDWWTFGVFLYELLYGKTPFKGSENEETITNVVLQNIKFPDSPIVSSQARDLIRRLLVKEPENRLGTETGAAEIKRHPFFDGLNWALIRCAVPPQTLEVFDDGNPQLLSDEREKRFLDYGPNGDHLEFELF